MNISLTWSMQPLGEGALLLECTPVDTLTNRLMLALADQVTALDLPGIEVALPAWSSLLVLFDPLCLTRTRLEAVLTALVREVEPAPARPARVVDIQVRYGGEDGPDLPEVAARLGLSEAEVIALHTSQIYRVMMIGFAPGFPYLGPLPAALDLPRRSTPRTAVPAGSVAIAAGMTGIYPDRLPGGWHLIGRTEAQMFDPLRDPPTLVVPGDGVRFNAEAQGRRGAEGGE
ncbi:5-oxoprolinase subunit PxpB [Candidatus Chloroploca mongolica]|uniref:5-oxoprolinase subunit PxpB n=1 Tax=Candidatus Chloroploca mongolica TaxID=2528176 RepID=UPI0020B2DD88|nr:5-oxoprolinase subunit PxpB [Candidatus Chloroploca mongolica]